MANPATIITDHLDTWSSAIKAKSSAGRGSGKKEEHYGIKKLRELILELAVRGFLVPQDLEDEPAEELLKKIASERAQLLKKKKIKKQKLQPPISNAEISTPAPANWAYCRLNDIIQISSGDGLTSAKMAENGTIPVYGGNGINGYHDKSNISSRTLTIGRVGYYCGAIHITPDRAWVTDNAFVTTFSEENIYLEFLAWLLKGTDLKADENATAQPVISGRKLYPIIICLPPLAEQHRIVAKVDELMALCDQLEQQQEYSLRTHSTLVQTLLGALTATSERGQFAQAWERIASHFDTLFSTESSIDQLKQTILQLAVMGKLVEQDLNDETAATLLEKITAEKKQLIKEKKIRKQKPLPPVVEGEKPFEVPEGWAVARFYEICQEVSTGPFGSMIHKNDYIVGGVPLINPSHMINGKIIADEKVSVNSEKASELNSYAIYEGDIVMARRGEMGRCAIVTKDEDGWLCGTGSFVLRFNSEISRNYMLILFKSEKVVSYLRGESVGMTMTNLNHGILNKMPIILPPAIEQEQIVDKVGKLMTLCDLLKARLQTAQATQLHLADSLVESAIR